MATVSFNESKAAASERAARRSFAGASLLLQAMVVRVKILFLLGLFAASALEAGSTFRQATRVGISEPSRESRDEVPEKRLVVRVIDGDTIVVSPNEKVRLGVDTPEAVHPNKAVQCFGKDAKEFTRSLVESKSIRLFFDDSKPSAPSQGSLRPNLGLRLF